MYTLEIKTPIWNDRKWNGGKGQRAVGIDSRLLNMGDDNWLGVKILTRDSDGNRLYPNPMKILKMQAKKFQSEMRKNVLLYIVPISAFQEAVVETTP